MKASRYIVEVMPVLKHAKEQAEKLSNMFAKHGMKAGKGFAKAFGDSFKFSVGSLIADGIKNAITGAGDKLGQAKGIYGEKMTRDQKIVQKSDQYGISPSKLDALLKLANSYGIDEDTTLSSLGDFRKKIMTGKIMMGGKGDILSKYYSAVKGVSLQKDQRVKEQMGEDILGEGMENLYTRSPEELLERGNKSGLHFAYNSKEKMKAKDAQIRALAKAGDGADIDRVNTDSIVQNSAERNPNVSRTVAGYDNKEKFEILKYVNANTEMLKTAYDDMQKGMNKLNDAGIKIVSKLGDVAKEIKKATMGPKIGADGDTSFLLDGGAK